MQVWIENNDTTPNKWLCFLGDEAHTLWVFQHATKLREERVHMCGVWVKICSALIYSKEEATNSCTLIRREFFLQYSEAPI
jgi:hypothetical protein